MYRTLADPITQSYSKSQSGHSTELQRKNNRLKKQNPKIRDENIGRFELTPHLLIQFGAVSGIKNRIVIGSDVMCLVTVSWSEKQVDFPHLTPPSFEIYLTFVL